MHSKPNASRSVRRNLCIQSMFHILSALIVAPSLLSPNFSKKNKKSCLLQYYFLNACLSLSRVYCLKCECKGQAFIWCTVLCFPGHLCTQHFAVYTYDTLGGIWRIFSHTAYKFASLLITVIIIESNYNKHYISAIFFI